MIAKGFPDEILNDVRADSASSAVIAYSGHAYDDKFLLNKGLIGHHVTKLIVDYKKTTNPGFDASKRYEFWKRWLLEAIPETWESSQ